MAARGQDEKVEIPRQVSQVRARLLETFTGLIDDADIGHFKENDARSYEQRFLSRSLAALAVRRLAKCSTADAAAYVTDGISDHGLDAIAPLPENGSVYLVQAKWSDKGTATFDLDAAKALIDGLNRIDNELYEQFNLRAATLAQKARPLLNNGTVKLVVALMGTQGPQPPAQQVLDNAVQELNKYGARYDVTVLLCADFFHQVRDDLKPSPIDLEIELKDWYPLNDKAFHGTVSAEQVAAWHETHGSLLFEQNVRAPLGVTATNREIGRTLTEDPLKFWHLNNGITLTCSKIDGPIYGSAKVPRNYPVRLPVKQVSIVNGAQTVRAVAEAMHLDGETAANASISIKVIETGGDKDFAVRVSQAANRQNAIEQRDRVVLDPVHEAVKLNVRAELRKLYVVKRGEPAPAPETGFTLDELALAFACMHPDTDHCARVAASTENLWEQGVQGSYAALFATEPTPQRAWHSVQSLRATRSEVYEYSRDATGRAAAVAEHGSFLATHIVSQYLGTTNIDDPDSDFSWESEVLEKIPALVPDVLNRLLAAIDIAGDRPQVKAAFQDPQRCRELAETVLAGLRDTPGPLAKPRKSRRQNTVPFLVDRRVLKDGTPLEYYGGTAPERAALEGWLVEDERRRRASWVNDRVRPILWEYDKEQYSPSGLVTRMWKLAKWASSSVANQGTLRWYPDGGEVNLWGLALRIREEGADSDQEDDGVGTRGTG